MKSWIKYGLAGALILVASFWGGSVRAAQMHLGRDAALPGQTVAKAVLPTGAHFQPLGALPSVAAGLSTSGQGLGPVYPDQGGEGAAYGVSTQAGLVTEPDIAHPARRWPLGGR